MAESDYALFTRIIAAGSLSAAARSLHMSTAMVSKRLARLEARLGTALVHRTTRRIALTQAGSRFHSDVIAILQAIEAAEQRVGGNGRDVSGPLKITAPTSFGRLHVAPHLGRFLDLHPDVEVQIDLSDAFADLVTDQIDVAIRIAPTTGSSLKMRMLAPNHRVLCAAPGYVAQFGAPGLIAHLSNHRLLAASGQLPWRLTDRDGRTETVSGESHVRTNSSEVVRELALAGAGIALRSQWDVADELSSGGLVRVLDSFEGAQSGIYAVLSPPFRPSPATRAFIDFLSKTYAPHPYWERETPVA